MISMSRSRPGGGLRSSRVRLGALTSLVFVGGTVVGTLGAQYAVSSGAVFESPGGTRLEVLLDAASLGNNDVEVGEITFPVGADSGMHPHGSTEVFYVLEGVLEHTVNGSATELGPGMVGFVRPPDQVRHRVVGDTPVRAIVIWAPGGEAARVTGDWQRVP